MILMFDKLIASCRQASRLAVWLGGGLILICAFLVSFDVISRKFFGYTISGSDELTSYAFAISTSWALAFTLLERYHVRIDALYLCLPRRICAALDIISLLAFIVFIGVLTYQAAIVFRTSLQFSSHANTPLQTPLAVPQGLWLIGLFGFSGVILLLLLRAVWAFVMGDIATVRTIAGVRTQEEEVADELNGGKEGIG